MFGDYSKDLLPRYLGDPDWVIRSMAIQYLGLVGDVQDFERLLSELPREPNNFATAEEALAVLWLSR